MNVIAVVPSYQPDEKLNIVIDGLLENSFPVVLVDDGSTADKAHYFEQASAKPGVTLLRHDVNKGKGRAMKTAFAHIYQQYSVTDAKTPIAGVVTVDGDNQHQPQDILHCVEYFNDGHADDIVLGVRNFSEKDVPLRSRIGNNLTSLVFRILFRMPIVDTQTGLRVLPYGILPDLCELEGERYEFESKMFLYARDNQVNVEQVPITTVYIEENQTSHFNVLRDSASIYFTLLKYGLNSFASWLMDLGIYTGVLALLNYPSAFDFTLSQKILLSTVVARICSSLFNFFVGRSKVFKSKERMRSTLLRYYAVVLIQVVLSYAAVYGVTSLLDAHTMVSSVVKPFVDGALFFASFIIQKKWVFAESRRSA